MNVYRRILAVLAALILCFSMSATAWAADTAPAEPVEAEESSDEISFEGKSWDEIMDELLEKFDTSRDSVSVAYVNLVSGE